MPSDPIDEFLKKFDALNVDQRAQLIDELEKRHVVTNGSSEERTLLQAFQERGLIGSIKGAPPDWSTNPDYLGGFGTIADAQ